MKHPRTCTIYNGITGEDTGGGYRQWVHNLSRDEWSHLGCLYDAGRIGNAPKGWRPKADA